MDTHLLIAQLRRLSKGFAGATALLGASIALARLYFFGTAVEPQFPHFVASVCFLLCGAAMYLRQREQQGGAHAASLATAVLGIALLTIAYYLAIGMPVATAMLVIMPPNTAISLLLLATAILLLPGGPRRLLAAQIFALIGLTVSILAIAAYAFGAYRLVRWGGNMPMTAGIAVLLCLLSLSILFLRPDAGLMRVLVSPGTGGVMARRLFSPALAIPLLTAWLTYQWQQGNLHGNMHGNTYVLTIAAASATLLLSVFFWSQAIALDRYDDARQRDHSQLARIADNLRILVQAVRDYAIVRLDAEGRIVSWNNGAQRILGYGPDDIIGAPFARLFAHDEQQAGVPAQMLEAARRRGHAARKHWSVRNDGTLCYAYSTMTALYEGGTLAGFVNVTQDISQGKRAAEEHALLSSMLSAMPDAVIVIDERGVIERVNPASATTFGYPVEELIGHNVSMLMPSPHRERHDAYIAHYLRSGERHVLGITREMVAQRKDGSAFPIELRVSEMLVAGRRKFTGVVRDISERKAAEDALIKSKQDLDVALEGANIHLWHLDCPARTLHHLDKLPQALGLAQEEARRDLDFWLSLIHPEDRQRLAKQLGEIERQRRDAGEAELRLRTQNSHWKWMLVRARILQRDARGAPLRVAGTCLDITARKQAEQEMLHLAQHDALTGLPNRALSYAFGERTLASARRDGLQSAVLFVDLDRFKPINDTYGHDAGDAVLVEVARRLRGCVRAEDVVGRLGGDEFLVVLADVDGPRGAGRVAAQCIAALCQPCPYKELRLQVSSSIGIAMFPADGDDIFTLTRNADTAMYHAKECGRDNFQFFTEELNERAASALVMENRLRGGLRQNEFRLYYQPIVALESGKVIGAEALLRWPDAGVAPEQFIPVAEYTGLIHQLGEWTLFEACRQQRAWQANGLAALTMSVNVSPAQFRQAGFRGTVAKAVAESGIAPDCLQLEITENVLVKSSETVVETLQALKQLGVHVVLDDFGKGYSSLSYLKRLPVDAIKIDKDFIHDLDIDRGNMAITAAIINLGQELGLQVIAEGIESEAVLASLQARRCQAIQGFYVCQPVAGDEFEDWYRNHSALAAA